MATILDTIVTHKKEELTSLKETISIDALEASNFFSRKCVSLRESLLNSNSGIIAEFKRKSPSKGFIHEFGDPTIIVPGYEKNGASGVSILQDRKFFAGGGEDMIIARPMVNIPLLYKEFIIDEYQLTMAKSCGADAVLLIAAILSIEDCKKLAKIAHNLGMETLLELHDKEEVSHLNDDIDIVGVNNRNLKTFEVNIDASILLCHTIPEHFLKISESGISDPQTVIKLRNEGFKGFLMGENFMKTENPPMALHNFIQQLGNN